MKTKMEQGSAWSEAEKLAPLWRGNPHDDRLTLTIPGTEDDLRMYLNAGHVQALIWQLDGELRDWIKHGGHDFKTPDEVMEWVRGQLGQTLDE